MTTYSAGTVAMLVTRTTYSSCRAGDRRPAADDRHLLRDRQLLAVADDDDRRLRARSPDCRRRRSADPAARSLRTRAWLLISVPAGTPALTRRSN